jgi:hypothetical protein
VLIDFRVVFLNLYLRDTHILGIGEAAMTHIAHGASFTASCYNGSRMWRYNLPEKRLRLDDREAYGCTVDALAEFFYWLPGGCHRRSKRDERGVV